MAHINQVVDLLRYLVETRRYPLPVEPREAAILPPRPMNRCAKSPIRGLFLPALEFRGFGWGC